MRDRLTDTAKDLESPFLDEEILTAEPHDAAEPRVARLAEHSPFEGLLFPGRQSDAGVGRRRRASAQPARFLAGRGVHRQGGIRFQLRASVPHDVGLHARGVPEPRRPHRADREGEESGPAHSGDQPRVGRLQHPALLKGSPAGFTITQRQIEAVNAGDGALMDALLGKLVDLDATTDQGQTAWTALLVHLESSAPDALKPFGLSLRTRGRRPPGTPAAPVRGSRRRGIGRPGIHEAPSANRSPPPSRG